jgi:DNA-binding NarL/FixJ family response regulator
MILVVDDDLNFIMLLKAYLKLQGYEVVSAQTRSQAIAALKQFQPNLLILSDSLSSPEIQGFGFLEKLKQDPFLSWIPVIFLSNKYRSQDRVRGLTMGANVYMVKPFDLHELVAQIESSIRSVHLLQQNKMRHSPTKIQVPDGIKLTNTEALVAKLVARGMSNHNIAQELNISKRTIENHVSHILRKAELNNRTELSRWIIENNMDLE